MRTAYDTAWIARLGEIDYAMSNAALQWICEHQLADGSWGAPEPMYYHDRVISTLAAMTALCRRGRRASDRSQIEAGERALERIVSGATQGLMADPNGATAGFEVIVPTLVAEAEALGILKCNGDRILWRLANLRSAKLARLNGSIINRNITMAHSAEMAGPDHTHLLDVDNLQEPNGSVAYSPSATAYYAINIRRGDPAALAYLRGVVDQDGGVPGAAPFDIYERAWVLWNLILTGALDEEITALCQPHIDCLEAAWNPQKGVGFGTGYPVPDGDDTALVYAVLKYFGRDVNFQTFRYYEEKGHYRCYALEVNPSPSMNAHILDVLQREGADSSVPAVQKILNFLRATQLEGGYWFDKWHTSPYYTSAHVVLACAKYDAALASGVVDWFLNSQNRDGSWGFYSSTAEETAYAIQALCYWNQHGGSVPKDVIRRAVDWLSAHTEPPYPAQWIAKTLYYSEWVVRSEIISALVMASQI